MAYLFCLIEFFVISGRAEIMTGEVFGPKNLLGIHFTVGQRKNNSTKNSTTAFLYSLKLTQHLHKDVGSQFS